jgi:hypothetical protein
MGMQQDRTETFFAFVGDLEQEGGHLRYCTGEGGELATCYDDPDDRDSIVWQVFGAKDREHPKQLAEVHLLYTDRAQDRDSLIWHAGRHDVNLIDKPPDWAVGLVAIHMSYEGIVAEGQELYGAPPIRALGAPGSQHEEP